MNNFKDRTGRLDARLIAVVAALSWVIASAYLAVAHGGAFMPGPL